MEVLPSRFILIVSHYRLRYVHVFDVARDPAHILGFDFTFDFGS